MTSATGNNSARLRSKGFSLIEILLVIALIALAASMMIANVGQLADRSEEIPVDEQIKAAIRTARFEAARHRQTARLLFNGEKGQLEVYCSEDQPAVFDLGADYKDNGPGAIRFQIIPPAKGMENLPDPYNGGWDCESLLFAPDRSSQAFAVEIDTGSGSTERLVFDPFSSLVLSPQ